MTIEIPSVVLNNGVVMPLFGLGTSHNGGYNHETVKFAINDCGYRLIDTAKRYGTESFIGQAIVDIQNVSREEIFLTTKLWPDDYGFQSTLESCFESTQLLRTNYLDLYLMHCPLVREGCNRKQLLKDTWRAMELLLESGRCRAIGVSNFKESDLEELLEFASVVPQVNQVEFHPFHNPKSLRDFCSENRIQFMGYCPLAKGRLLTEPVVVDVAKQLGFTPAQVLLRWSVQNKVVTIPKSTKKERVAENIQVLRNKYHIPETFMNILDSLHIDPSKKVVKEEQLIKSVNSDLPHGYKLMQASNVFPDTQFWDEV